MKAKLIDKPNGGGGSTKDGNINNKLFYVTIGRYGNVKCTGVIFSGTNLEYWFEGHVYFKDESEVFMCLIENNIDLITIINVLMEISFDKGFSSGKNTMKNDFRKLLGV